MQSYQTINPPRIPPNQPRQHYSQSHRTKTVFYKLHDIRAVTAALRTIMDREDPPPALFPPDNNTGLFIDTDIMRDYAIDILFDCILHR